MLRVEDSVLGVCEGGYLVIIMATEDVMKRIYMVAGEVKS